MLAYAIRRLFLTIPTLLVISFIVFSILALAPGDPTGTLPLTIPPEVKAKMREAMGLDQGFWFRYYKWLVQFFWTEPLFYFNEWLGLGGDGTEPNRMLSYRSRSPVFDQIFERMPQTLWVVGTSYIVGIVIAIPIGVYSAYRQYSFADQLGTFVSTIGFAVPTFFTGLLCLTVFSYWLVWLPSKYDTTLVVDSWPTFWQQIKQMIMPVMVLGFYNAAQISRFMRASMLDNLNQDYIRTARAKGMREKTVLLAHAFRNSLIPVVTLIALGIPQIFGGAIITEQIFGVNGLGEMLINGIREADAPVVQTLTFIFAILTVLFNLIADLLYGLLDPRIRYD